MIIQRIKAVGWACLTALLFVCGARSSAEVFSETIRADLEQGRIARSDAVYYEAIRALRPELLPDRYAADVRMVQKCGAHLIQEIRRVWPEWSSVQQSHLAPFAFRPDLDTSFVTPDGRFRIHFDTDPLSSHRVPSEDADGSSIPDYVEHAAEYLMHSYKVEIEEMGLQEPPPDDDPSGPEWDVYLLNIPAFYGYVSLDEQVGTDPDIYTTFMTLDNDYVHTSTKGLEALRVTVAHEFLHMIQFGCVFRDLNHNGVCDDQFLNEAASTWMEDRVYDGVNDYLYYLPAFFQRTNRPFDTFDGQREYGLSIWFHFLDKRFHGMDMLRRIMNAMIFYPAMEACDAALRELGNTFPEQLALFYAWNTMTGDRADTVRFYPEGHLYPQIFMDSLTPFHQDTLFSVSVRPTASRYYGFHSINNSLITLIPVHTGMPVYEPAACLLGLRSGGDQPDYTPLGDGLQAGLFTDTDVIWECMGVRVPQSGLSGMTVIRTNHGSLTGSISGAVWEDGDGDGVLDEGAETGLPDVRLSLTEAGKDGLPGTEDDVVFPSEFTASGGDYVFRMLYSGHYRISVDASTVPEGYLSTTGGLERDIAVPDSQSVENVDFGFRELDRRPAAIPNPFIPAEHDRVRIPVDLTEPRTVQLNVYALSGFVVKEHEAYFPGGLHFIEWDGRDSDGELLPSGVYLYVIQMEGTVLRREKLVIVR